MKNTQTRRITTQLRHAIAALYVFATLVFASMLSQANAAVILSEDFENEGLNSAYFALNAGSFDGPRTARDWHWERHSANVTSNTSFYRGFQGQDYWVGINLDENGSSASMPSRLSLNSVDISDYENTTLSISAAASGGLENSDYLAIYAQDQSANAENISNVSASSPISSQKVLIDSFFGGVSLLHAIELNATFQTFSYDLSEIDFSAFSLHFDAFTNASKESVAFDDIIISADLKGDNQQSNNYAVHANSPALTSSIGLISIALVVLRRRAKLGQIFPSA